MEVVASSSGSSTDPTVGATTAQGQDASDAPRGVQSPDAGPRGGLRRAFGWGDDGAGDAKPGDFVGRYLVLGRLGEGGMGVVLSAYDAQLDRKVAIKLIRTVGGRRSAQAHARLLREAQAMARLTHPHVVTVHDVGEHEGGVFIAMEHVEGVTLGAWCAQRARSWPEVVAVFVQAAAGLAAAHARDIVHRDFKPDNVMIGGDGRVRVMDFGLAREASDETAAETAGGSSTDRPGHRDPRAATSVLGRAAQTLAAGIMRRPSSADEGATLAASVPGDETPGEMRATPAEPRAHAELGDERIFEGGLHVVLTQAGAILGTPAYMAPEQHLGHKAGPAADQFAFGVALWEAIYGERPFAGGSFAELALAVTEGARRPAPARVHVPRWLARVLERLIETEPERRFSSLEAVREALTSGQARARRAKAAIALGSLALVAVGVLGAQAWQTQQKTQECRAAGAEIEADWNDEVRERIHAAIAASELPYARSTADRVLPWIDARVDEWSESATKLCLDAIAGERSPRDVQRGRWCLDERRAALAALADGLARANAQAITAAVSRAANLEGARVCSDPDALARLQDPPAAPIRPLAAAVLRRVARIDDRRHAERWEEASRELVHTQALSDSLNHPPLSARVQVAEGKLAFAQGDYIRAVKASRAAYFGALGSSAWSLASDVATDLAYIEGEVLSHTDVGLEWIEHARAMGTHAEDLLESRAAGQRTYEALIYWRKGDYERAIELGEQALKIREGTLGPSHPQVASVLSNLGMSLRGAGRHEEAIAAHRRALEIRKQALGAGHPEVGNSWQNLAAVQFSTGAYEDAGRSYAAVRDIWEAAYGPDHPDLAGVYYGLGIVEHAQGRYDGVEPAYRRAIEVWTKAYTELHPNVALGYSALGELARDRGDPGGAVVEFKRALAIYESTLGADHPDLTYTLIALAMAHRDEGAHDQARAAYDRCLSIADARLGPQHPRVAELSLAAAEGARARGDHDDERAHLERAVAVHDATPELAGRADARFRLAMSLSSTRRGNARARALAERALAELRSDPGAGTIHADEVEAWLARATEAP